MTGSITQQGALHGKVCAESTLSGQISAEKALTGYLYLPGGYIDYTGNYDVRPTVDAQTLPTADRRMLRDVHIHPIPFFEVSNHANGDTVIIGGQIDPPQ